MPDTQPRESTETRVPSDDETAENTTEQAAPETPAADPVLPKRLLFRLPMASLVGVAFLVLCESVVAFAGVWLTLLYLIPLAITYWLVRTRTVIDVDAIEVRRAFTRTRIPWTSVASLRVRDRKWVRAVLGSGREITMPAVHVRHLSALAVISGGRIADPLAARPAEADDVTDVAADEADNRDEAAE